MSLQWSHARRGWFAALSLIILIAGLPATMSAEAGQGRAGDKSEAAPGKKGQGAVKPPKENRVRPAPRGSDESIPEEQPPPGNDGCPFFEQRLELIV